METLLLWRFCSYGGHLSSALVNRLTRADRKSDFLCYRAYIGHRTKKAKFVQYASIGENIMQFSGPCLQFYQLFHTPYLSLVHSRS